MKLIAEGYTFDDIILKPRKTSFPTRSPTYIDLSTWIIPEKLKLDFPIISANMDTVTGEAMMIEMYRLGCLGIVHRFMSVEEQSKILQGTEHKKNVACIGVGNQGFDRWLKLRPWADTVLIDVAHGHSQQVIDQIKRIKEAEPDVGVIAGNIATYEGAIDLIVAGADCLKVGVGPGSLCSTRINTGCGVPQVTAIMEVQRAVYQVNKPTSIIADGGIRNPGDIIKALACGADCVMIGNLFAGTTETPGETFVDPRTNIMYKTYRGMSSKEAQQDWKGHAKSIEGEVTQVPWKGTVKRIFDNLIQNLLSAMSYQNARNIGELQANAEAYLQTAAGITEASPHALKR